MHDFVLISQPMGICHSQGSLSLRYLYVSPEKTGVSIYDLVVMPGENGTLPVNKYVSVTAEAL